MAHGSKRTHAVARVARARRVVRNSNNEKRELQAQLSETIGSYTEAPS
jgi:hypothetical protein